MGENGSRAFCKKIQLVHAIEQHMELKAVLQCTAGLQCVAMCCSVLQCVAVCCSVLQCIAVVKK